MTDHSFDLSAVMLPVTTALGLPNPFYTDPALFEAEKTRLFFPNWAAVGFVNDCPAPGDAKPIKFLGQPLVLVRDRQGVLRVFQNICRHRGMILVAEEGPIARVIRCPYHAWSYELDGALRTTPHVGGPGNNRHEAIKREELGLIEVRSHQWMGVVFVNIDGKAPAFEEVHGDLMERWAEFDRPIHDGGAESRFMLEVATNWKLAVENYCESYHLPWVHPGLNSYSRLEDHYNIQEPRRFSGQGTRVYRPMLSPDGRRFPVFEGLSERWEEGAEYVALYPNVLLGVHKDQTFAIILEPVDHQSTIERVQIFFASDAVKGDDWSELRIRNGAMWKEVFVEDIFVVEGMQAGRHASGFDGGRFSPVMDNPTHCFHDWVAAEMTDAVA